MRHLGGLGDALSGKIYQHNRLISDHTTTILLRVKEIPRSDYRYAVLLGTLSAANTVLKALLFEAPDKATPFRRPLRLIRPSQTYQVYITLGQYFVLRAISDSAIMSEAEARGLTSDNLMQFIAAALGWTPADWAFAQAIVPAVREFSPDLAPVLARRIEAAAQLPHVSTWGDPLLSHCLHAYGSAFMWAVAHSND